MLEETPELLNSQHDWSATDHETAIQAAGQLGNAAIARFLLERGAPLEICTAAMLGDKTEVERRISENPKNALSRGAHNIPLLPHAVWSGSLQIVQFVFRSGGTEGASPALHNAISRGYHDIVVWLVENTTPDLQAKNYQGKTSLTLAIEGKRDAIAEFLKKNGAKE